MQTESIRLGLKCLSLSIIVRHWLMLDKILNISYKLDSLCPAKISNQTFQEFVLQPRLSVGGQILNY